MQYANLPYCSSSNANVLSGLSSATHNDVELEACWVSGIPYNVINTINIVATDCIGSSSVVMETIRISTLYDYIHSNFIIIDSGVKLYTCR